MKTCQHCESELTSRKQVKFCSIKCQNDFQYQKYISDWKDGLVSGEKYEGEVSNHIRRWLFEQHDSKCSKCMWSVVHPITDLVPLQVNHIDGDWSNHRPDNIELLCPNCHSLTPTFGNLNKGRGRRKR